MPQGDRRNYGQMKGLAPITLRLNKGELVYLDKLQQAQGLSTRQEALRLALLNCCYNCASNPIRRGTDAGTEDRGT